MIAFLLAPIYLLVNYYVLRWALRWMGACHKHFKSKYFRIFFITFYIFVSTSLLTAFLIKQPALHRFLKVVSNYWLGTFLYILLVIAIIDLGRLILKRTKLGKKEFFQSNMTFVLVGTCSAILTISLSVFGILHAKHIYTTNYEVTVDKSCASKDSMKIVLVADFHLGYSIGDWHMKQMVKDINKMDADLVCIAGDIFDNEYDAIKDPVGVQKALQSIKSTYGVYACYGNHDLNEKILAGFTFKSKDTQLDDPRMEQLLLDSNIKLLNDEVICVNQEFYVVGRKDPSMTKKKEDTRKSPAQLLDNLDHTKPIFVMDHQPKQLQELADAGADLDLSGHTHDGQMFPGNLSIKLMWENACGMIKKDDMYSIVTSGIGVWGPNMRVGTKSEIVVITVNFK